MDTLTGARNIAYTIERALPGARCSIQRLRAGRWQVSVRYTDGKGQQRGLLVNSPESWAVALRTIKTATSGPKRAE